MSGLGDESECVSVLSVIGLDPNINYSLVMGPVFNCCCDPGVGMRVTLGGH